MVASWYVVYEIALIVAKIVKLDSRRYGRKKQTRLRVNLQYAFFKWNLECNTHRVFFLPARTPSYIKHKLSSYKWEIVNDQQQGTTSKSSLSITPLGTSSKQLRFSKSNYSYISNHMEQSNKALNPPIKVHLFPLNLQSRYHGRVDILQLPRTPSARSLILLVQFR